MPHLHICPLAHVGDRAGAIRPTSMISMLSPSTPMPPTPKSVLPAAHLKLAFHDVAKRTPDYQYPTEDHVDQILQAGRTWDRRGPLLIHCYAGISRSTAAAYMIACALQKEADEFALAEALRAASRTAIPNLLMIAYADQALRRNGRMIKAVEAMGIEEFGTTARPFDLPIKSSAA